jgi:hypothetical protein
LLYRGELSLVSHERKVLPVSVPNQVHQNYFFSAAASSSTPLRKIKCSKLTFNPQSSIALSKAATEKKQA